MKKLIALLLMGCMVLSMTACGGNTAAPTTAATAAATEAATEAAAETTQSQEEIDKAAADAVAQLIDAIYVQTRNEDTDAQCEQAKAAWDALTDAQKELVEGEEASPEYFGLDTGDAKLDDRREGAAGGFLWHFLQRQPCHRHQGH